ncbi:MAG: orotidine-5'-phosphate decarboxylase [Candidatus Anstonellaceae archaeon]
MEETTYYQILERKIKKTNSLLCFGIDPIIEKIPKKINGSKKQIITEFYSSILDNCQKNKISALKPNYAFFAQYGFEGIMALREIIDKYKEDYLIILDAKRGDIGKTSQAYVKEVFEFFGADATTIWPFMGFDSVLPFIEYANEKKKGVYFLARTTNPGAEDFLTLKTENGKALFEEVATKVSEWSKEYNECLGLVMGATSPLDLELILKPLYSRKEKLAFLIPGIGAQGGDPLKIIEIIKKYQMEKITLVNASSSIAYAYLKKDLDYIEAALEEIKELANILKLD